MRVPHFLPSLLPVGKKNIEVPVPGQSVDNPTEPFDGDSQGSSTGIIDVFHTGDVVLWNQERVEIGEGVDV